MMILREVSNALMLRYARITAPSWFILWPFPSKCFAQVFTKWLWVFTMAYRSLCPASLLVAPRLPPFPALPTPWYHWRFTPTLPLPPPPIVVWTSRFHCMHACLHRIHNSAHGQAGYRVASRHLTETHSTVQSLINPWSENPRPRPCDSPGSEGIPIPDD